MKFMITGRHIDVTDGLRDRIHKRLGKLSKFFHSDAEVHVTLDVEKERQIVEVTIPYKGMLFRAEEVDHDMYTAIDMVVDVLERQIRKNKTRLEKKMREGAFVIDPSLDTLKPVHLEVEEEKDFKVLKTKRFAIKPMNLDEAILQMNLIGHQFYVFFNSDAEEVNVVYKRKDGYYGLIEPEF